MSDDAIRYLFIGVVWFNAAGLVCFVFGRARELGGGYDVSPSEGDPDR